ncbi:MAG TPA: hypothetical protein VN228_08500 [Pyrinomonadaceae bacterium]|nr:hypothetical protein [Pyrinomonadaceae bacterium]
MRHTDQTGTAESHEKRLRVLRILWAAFLVNVVLLALVAYVAAPEADAGAAFAGGGEAPGGLPTPLVILFALGLLALALSFLLKGRVMRRAHEGRRPDLVQTAVIVGLACCEATALFGFVALFVSGHSYSFLLFAAGAAGQLLHFPRREEVLLGPYKTLG